MYKKSLVWLLVISALLFLTSCDNSDRDVTISLAPGTYYGEQHITLSCIDPTAQITYTLDGSDPKDSNLVYDSETGIEINYTSDLKATAGGNIAEAHYDIIPYDSPMDTTQRAFYNKIMGSWSTDESMTTNFVVSSSSVTFQGPAGETKSGYFLKDVNGDTATMVYTDNDGKNVEIPIQVIPDSYTIVVNGVQYIAQWYYY